MDLFNTHEPEMPPVFGDLEQARTSVNNTTNATMGVKHYMDFTPFSSQLDAEVARKSIL